MSQLTVNTIKLQNTIARAVKAAGFNKLLPITSMIGMKQVGDYLSFITTDGTNYLYNTIEVDCDEEFDITVDVSILSGLVSKLTSEDVTFDIKDDVLVIIGNGTYKLPMQLDDEGNLLSYPDPMKKIGNYSETSKISASDIEVILKSLKSSLSTVGGSIYTNYYVGDVIASTDKAMVALYEQSFLQDEYLFSREFVDLLGLFTSDIEFKVNDEYLVANDEVMTLCAKKNTEVEGFNVAVLKKMLNFEFDSFCKINKQAMLSTLERLAIFVGQYDDKAIKLHFKNDGIEIYSLNSSGVEFVDFMESKNAKDMEVKINIDRLITQLKAYLSDSVELYYGSDKLLKLSDGKITQIIAYII